MSNSGIYVPTSPTASASRNTIVTLFHQKTSCSQETCESGDSVLLHFAWLRQIPKEREEIPKWTSKGAHGFLGQLYNARGTEALLTLPP
jgi:hypothetical protein